MSMNSFERSDTFTERRRWTSRTAPLLALLHALLLLPALDVTAEPPPGNLVEGVTVEGARVTGRLGVVVDGKLAPEGTDWDSPLAVRLLDESSSVTLDLGAPYPIHGLVLQGDDNDTYAVEVSTDTEPWRIVWIARPVPDGPGLRTRQVSIETPPLARRVRVRPFSGDGKYSVSELRVYATLPETFPVQLVSWRLPFRWALDNETVLMWKMLVALLAAGTLLLPAGRFRDVALGTLGLASVALFFNVGRFHFDNYLHRWDLYHYVLGAKYAPELGYTRLYKCTLAAEGVLGEGRFIRDLVTNQLGPSGDVAALERECRTFFSDERWEEFQGDVRFFKEREPPERWATFLHDNGYNGSPVWAIAGHALTNTGPLTEGRLLALGLLDPLLLLFLWTMVVRTFGWRPACVAAVWWGTNYPARFWWNGGSFLRMDWLTLTVVAVCLLKVRKELGAGLALATAALLRVFPGFLGLGIGMKTLVTWYRERKVPPFVRGGVLALVVLVPLSVVIGGPGVWPGFVANSRKHLDTPFTNNVGWKMVVAWSPETRAVKVASPPGSTDPYAGWKDARRRLFGARRITFYAGLGLFALLVVSVALREEEWVAAALSVGLVPMASELASYYQSVLLIYGLLWVRSRAVGVLLCLLSAGTCACHFAFTWDDDRYTAVSLLIVAFVWLATLAVAGRREPVSPVEAGTEAVVVGSPEKGNAARRGRRSRRRLAATARG